MIRVVVFAVICLQLVVVWSRVEPSQDGGRKNIFFVETKAPEDRIAVLHHRQACSIESASRTNPDWNIFLYIFNVSRILNNDAFKVIRELPNVYVKMVDFNDFVRDTPTEQLVRHGLHTRPEWLVSHTSGEVSCSKC